MRYQFRSRFLLLFLALLATGCFDLSRTACAADADRRPNVILILVDDMGWTDLGCFGSRFHETPNLDKLAGQGMKFTQAYSACTVCSPTRASLLTGQYPARLHITDWIAGHARPFAKLKVPDWTIRLATDEVNLARRLKSAGYATVSIGKWHLGNEEHFPEKQGFDANIGGTHKGQPPSYVAPYKIATLPEEQPGEFLTDRESREAVKFIEAHKDQPFFIYLPHYAVHQPIAGKPAVVDKYKKKAKPDEPHHNATYAALVESVDDSVGRIVSKLDELKLSERTIVIFTSDNGGLLPTTSNVPLRAGKGSAYEGGVRVPLIVRWPGAVKAGAVCETPVISPDLYPTILELAGVKDAEKHVVDGESLAPPLQQSGTLKRAAIFWHYPHYHPGGATPYGAIRKGDHRLVEFYEDGRVELYNLKDDVGEKTDLAEKSPELVKDLKQRLDAWRREVGAQMPAPNPAHDASKDGPRKKPK